MGGINVNGEDVLTINRVNGAWDMNSVDVFFRSSDIGMTDALLGNTLQQLNNVNLAGLVAALLDINTRVIDIDGLHVEGDTLYFSLQPITSFLFDSLGDVLPNPFDPLAALTFRGEDIFSVSKNPITGEWDPLSLALYFDGSQYSLAANDGVLGGLLDTLPENVNSFSISQGTQRHDTLVYSIDGDGNEAQLNGSYDNQTLIQHNNGRFYESFDLAAISNNTITNSNITALHLLQSGYVLFSLEIPTTLPGGITVNPDDVIQWDGSFFSISFDGSAHGLSDSTMAIDSLYIYPTSSAFAGQMVLSFKDSGTLAGVGTFQNEDLIRYNPGNGTYSMLFDASSAGINDLMIDVSIQTNLSIGISTTVNDLFAPLVAELDQLASDLLGTINTQLTDLNTLVDQLNALNLGSLLGLNNIVNLLLVSLDDLLGTNLDGLVDGLSTQSGINNLVNELNVLIDELTPLPLLLITQAVLVNNITTLSNTLITELNALDVTNVSAIDNAIDGVDAGIASVSATLVSAVDAGSTLQFKLLDVNVDGLHIMDNGDYLLSFSQVLRLDLNLTIDTSFLNQLASLGLSTDLQGLIYDVNHVLDPIIAPVLADIDIADVLSPDMDLIGMNIYQLHFDTGSSTWQFSMYFDGKDHGLENGTSATSILEYVDSIDPGFNLMDLQSLGLMHLSSNENLNDFHIIQNQNLVSIQGTQLADLMIGDSGNNTFNGGLGNDLMIGNGGENVYVIDNSSIKPTIPQQDLIADFNAQQGDKLYFDDIFNGYNGNSATLSNFIDISIVNNDGLGGANDTLISVKNDVGGNTVHSVVLLNYTVSGATSQDMLQNLISQGAIEAT